MYAYAREELDAWQERLGELRSGMFGENLTTSGLDVDGAVGERWQVGDEVVLEVAGPRIPCSTFASRMGEKAWVKGSPRSGTRGPTSRWSPRDRAPRRPRLGRGTARQRDRRGWRSGPSPATSTRPSSSSRQAASTRRTTPTSQRSCAAARAGAPPGEPRPGPRPDGGVPRGLPRHRPLRGVRVVELASIGPGPHAAMTLADLGADVIRIERPEGTLAAVDRDKDVLTRGRPTSHGPQGPRAAASSSTSWRAQTSSSRACVQGRRSGSAWGPSTAWPATPGSSTAG